jgi:membrane associated rhomboid family serine protease
MSAVFRIGEEEPLFHLGEFPVRLITLLVALHSAAMVAATLLLASGHGALLDFLAYNSASVARGQVWRLVSYAFVAGPSIWFLLEMLMLYYFGREVERGLGWKRFAILYAGLILLAPLLLQAVSVSGRLQVFAGAQEVNFAIFAAFTAMHPGAQFFFGVAARWVFAGLLAISALQDLADHQPSRVLVLVASSLLAVVLMKRAGFNEPLFGLSQWWRIPDFLKPRPRFSVVEGGKSPSAAKQNGQKPRPALDPEEEMDRLLEKISRKGIGSLSAEERNSLEQARRAILQRGGEA